MTVVLYLLNHHLLFIDLFYANYQVDPAVFQCCWRHICIRAAGEATCTCERDSESDEIAIYLFAYLLSATIYFSADSSLLVGCGGYTT